MMGPARATTTSTPKGTPRRLLGDRRLPPLVLFLWSALLFVPDLLAGGGVRGMDLSLGFVPLWSFGRRWLSQGVLPLWNPHTLAGQPFFAEPHGLLYPPHWLVGWLPLPLAISLTVWLHGLLCGLFTYRLARLLPLRRGAALLAATAMMLSGAHTPHLHAGHVPYLEVMAWLPALCGVWLEHSRRPSLRLVLLGGVYIALIIATGFLQYAFYALAVLCLWTLGSAVAALRRRDRRQALLQGRGLLGTVLLGVGLCGFPLLPSILWSQHLARAASYEFATQFSLHPIEVLNLLIPGLLGDSARQTYFGPHQLSWETALYLGALVLPLAALGLGELGRGRRRALRPLLALGALAFLLCFGAHLPLYQALYELVPGFKLFRVPPRAFPLAALVLCLLAGVGVDSLSARLRRACLRPFTALLAALLLAYAAALAALLSLDPAGWQHHCARFGQALTAAAALAARRDLAVALALAAALLLAALAVLQGAARRPRLRALVPLLLTALVAADLLRVGAAYLHPADYREVRLPQAVVAALASRPGRVTVVTDNTHLNAPLIYGVDGVGGYEGGVLRKTNRFLAAALNDAPGTVRAVVVVNRVTPPLRLLNLRHLLVSDRVRLPASRFREEVRAEGMALYEIAGALPRALVVPRATYVRDEEAALRRVLDPGFDPRREVVLVGTEPGGTQAAPPGAGAVSSHLEGSGVQAPGAGVDLGADPKVESSDRLVRWRRPDPDHMELDVDAGAAGHLLIAEIAYPGWQARVNGAAVPLASADYLLRALPVPAGACRVTLSFHPPGLRAGVTLSLLSLLALLAGMLRLRARPRAAPPAP